MSVSLSTVSYDLFDSPDGSTWSEQQLVDGSRWTLPFLFSSFFFSHKKNKKVRSMKGGMNFRFSFISDFFYFLPLLLFPLLD